jgi:hypothetical protein
MVVFASVPGRERAVAEIWLGEYQFAELSSEGDELLVEVYPHPHLTSWKLPYQDLMALLEEVKTKLVETSAHDSKLSME